MVRIGTVSVAAISNRNQACVLGAQLPAGLCVVPGVCRAPKSCGG